jgi:hypothetical protein
MSALYGTTNFVKRIIECFSEICNRRSHEDDTYLMTERDKDDTWVPGNSN